MSERRDGVTVALVLGGGGARGAYEAGALSVLLPVLEDRGERPRIVIGTSAGALNASFLAAQAHLDARAVIPGALAIWESIRWGDVAGRLISVGSLRRVSGYAGEVLGLPGARLESLLDPAPLRATLRERVDFDQIERNVHAGMLDVVGVVATSALTGRSVVFHSGLGSPPQDRRRGIDYVPTALREDQVLASAAIPVVFPAVSVKQPTVARGWYFDGGARLNTPVKPALEFGAQRVVVIAVTSLAPGPAQVAGPQRPDALAGAGQILLGLLDDQLTTDVQTLATINGLTRASRVVAGKKRRVPYIVIAPGSRRAVGDLAVRVLRDHYGGLLQALRSPDISLLARLLAGNADAQHAELLSFLLFSPEFAAALIELGQHDAQRWVDQSHDLDDLWQIAPIRD
jgi:NTE family protein